MVMIRMGMNFFPIYIPGMLLAFLLPELPLEPWCKDTGGIVPLVPVHGTSKKDISSKAQL